MTVKAAKLLWVPVVLSAVMWMQPLSATGMSNKDRGRVPDEYESDGGHSLGLGAGGTAAVSGQDSVKSNPAMMVFEKRYMVSLGYHWPSEGRDFYQAGVIDSQTSSFAAGFTYTSPLAPYKPYADASNEEERRDAFFDTPVSRRVSIAAGQAFDRIALGIGGQIVKIDNKAEKLEGNTLGLGLAALATPTLRFGISAENLANRKVRAYAPTMYRAGFAYTMFGGDFTAHLDFRDRQRVSQELGIQEGLTYLTESDETKESLGTEKMAIASFSARVQNMIRLLGAYGNEIKGDRRRSLSCGLALVNHGFSLSYLVSRPYLTDPTLHQAVNMSFVVAL